MIFDPPILRAKAAHPPHRDFLADLLAHAVHGVVVSTPSLFLMTRPVRWQAEERLLENIRFRFSDINCWLVWSAAGPVTALVALMPFPLPYIAFHRHQNPRLRIYRTDRLSALAQCQRPHRSTDYSSASLMTDHCPPPPQPQPL